MQTLLVPAIFALRRDGQLIAMAESHVDYVLFVRMQSCSIRGREIEEDQDGFEVGMRQCASSLKGVAISRERRKQIEDPLTEAESKELWIRSGEIGWLGRRGRLDLAQLAGELQIASGSPCVADLAKCNVAVAEAQKGMDEDPLPEDVDSEQFGRWSGGGRRTRERTRERPDLERYRCCGGCCAAD